MSNFLRRLANHPAAAIMAEMPALGKLVPSLPYAFYSAAAASNCPDSLRHGQKVAQHRGIHLSVGIDQPGAGRARARGRATAKAIASAACGVTMMLMRVNHSDIFRDEVYSLIAGFLG